MKKKLSSIAYPALAGVVREQTKAAVIAEIRNCMYDGADMIDLHMSCIENFDLDTMKAIVNSTKLPILALNYNRTADWKNTHFTEEERAQSFLTAVAAGVAGVDMQGYTFHEPSRDAFHGEDIYSFTKGGPKEVVTDKSIIDKQCEFIETVHGSGAEVLLSCHPGIPMNCTQVVDLALFLEKRNPDIIKIVTRADNEDDLAESIKTMLTLKKEVKTPVSYHANGRAGMLSRIINPVLGGQIVFCVDKYSQTSTMEQLDLKTARSVVDNVRKIEGV